MRRAYACYFVLVVALGVLEGAVRGAFAFLAPLPIGCACWPRMLPNVSLVRAPGCRRAHGVLPWWSWTRTAVQGSCAAQEGLQGAACLHQVARMRPAGAAQQHGGPTSSSAPTLFPQPLRCAQDFPTTAMTFEAWISSSDFCHAGAHCCSGCSGVLSGSMGQQRGCIEASLFFTGSHTNTLAQQQPQRGAVAAQHKDHTNQQQQVPTAAGSPPAAAGTLQHATTPGPAAQARRHRMQAAVYAAYTSHTVVEQ